MSLPASIAVNAAVVGHRPTGLGVYALSMIAALDELGEPLRVYTSCPELIRARRAVVTPVSAGVRPERGARGHLRRLLWTQSSLRFRLHRDRPRLLLNLMPEGVLAPPIPQVTVVHDVLPLLYPAEYPRQQYYFRHYVPAVLRSSRAVVVISESTRRDLLRFYPAVADRVHVVYSGYDATRFFCDDTGPSVGDFYALYVGNIMPHKNLLRLVEAFGLAAPTAARLVIRGSGRPGYTAEVRAAIARAGLERRVDWQPYAPDEELPRLYRGARMLLLPSLHEGFGLPVLEAMACGTPVITSSTASLPEVAGDAALLVDPLDTRAIGDAIARLFAADDLAKTLRGRGLARVAQFSWRRAGQGVQAVLRGVLGGVTARQR